MRTSLRALLAAMALAQCTAGDPQGRRVTDATETSGEEESIEHYGFQSRIVGGTVASASDFPFHVNLGGCGGSLIHEDIVLTAAHCQALWPSSVKVGGGNRNSGVTRRIAVADREGKRHPNYNTRSQDYDIMLYKLSTPVKNLDVAPINSNENNPTSSGGDKLTVIGFGSTYEDGGGSFELREVDVNHVAHNRCNFAYGGGVERDIMFCAGVDGGGKDTCQGDSGGPIVDENGVQVGVTSWGNGCARAGYPGVYARISAVYDWIQQEICNMSDNPPACCENDSCDGDNANSGTADRPTDPSTTEAPTSSDTDSDSGASDLMQPKGISIRVDITYDEFPQENAWVLYNDETKEELYFSEYGDITSPGRQSEVFADLNPGRYVFLMLDEYWDGICCRYGQGMMQVSQIFPGESGRGDEVKWQHNGRFWNAAGAIFVVATEDDRRSLQGLSLQSEDIANSPYLPRFKEP